LDLTVPALPLSLLYTKVLPCSLFDSKEVADEDEASGEKNEGDIFVKS
jgi:hypothetical protein